jgi:MFS family permease
MIFVGMVLGAPTWGYLADKFGRRNIMLVSAVMVSLAGFGTALCTNVQTLIPCRALVGFSCAGCVVAFDIFSEALPTDWRGPLTMSTFYWFTIGSLYSNVAAKYSLCDYGWQVYTIACAVPTLIAAIAGFFLVPESAHWLVAEDRNEEAAQVLNGIADMNGANVEFGRLTQPEVLEDISTKDLCQRSKLRKPLILMCFVWLGWGLAYYGIAMLLPHLFQEGEGHEDAKGEEVALRNLKEPLGVGIPFGVWKILKYHRLRPFNATNLTPGVDPGEEVCMPTADNCYCITFEFGSILITNAMQAVGLTVGVALVDRIGRVKVQQVLYLISAVFAVGLGFPQMDHNLLTAISAISLSAQNGASSCTWSHTPELFPTHARVLATGLCSAMSKIGAALSPYVISPLIDDLPTALIMASFSLMAAIFVSFVKETAGGHIDTDDVYSSYATSEEE